MDLTSLDLALQFYFEQGLAQSTQRTYRAAMKRCVEVCSQYMIFNPFPLSEKLLCYYAVFLAKRRLAHQTIKTYTSATRNMHISLSFLIYAIAHLFQFCDTYRWGFKTGQAANYSSHIRPAKSSLGSDTTQGEAGIVGCVSTVLRRIFLFR